MGISKTNLFDTSQQQFSVWAKAFSHPARIAILEHILSVKSCICGDIVLALPLAQATISQHLIVLKQAGLIKGNIEGNAICYCIDAENWGKCKNTFLIFFEKLNIQNTCCS